MVLAGLQCIKKCIARCFFSFTENQATSQFCHVRVLSCGSPKRTRNQTKINASSFSQKSNQNVSFAMCGRSRAGPPKDLEIHKNSRTGTFIPIIMRAVCCMYAGWWECAKRKECKQTRSGFCLTTCGICLHLLPEAVSRLYKVVTCFGPYNIKKPIDMSR
jgi:hypothetical protein